MNGARTQTRPASPPMPSFTPVRSNLLQRECACGGTPGLDGECAECRKGRLQRHATNQGAPPPVPPIVHDVLCSPGQPLDSATRAFMEPRFGHDFGEVRVHADTKAARSARAVDALAYTLGSDVVFGAGLYAPGTAEGRRLLAHELTHVVQQGGNGTLQTHDELGSADDMYEHEANRMADSVAHGRGALEITPGQPHHTLTLTGRSMLQRQETGSTALDIAATSALTPVLGPLLAPLAVSTGHAAQRWWADPRNRQFADDLVASVREAPQHAAEVLVGEVWEAIREHWVRFLAVTLGLLTAELVIGILTGAPEPTLITKLVAAILQFLVIAIMGYFAAVEVAGAYDQCREWFSLARRANGKPATIGDASRAFLRMVRHLILAILAVAGVRARVRSFTIPRGVPASGGALPGSGGAGGAPAEVIPITRHPGFRPGGASAPPSGTVAYGPGGTALRIAPAEQPLPTPSAPVIPLPRPAPRASTPAAGSDLSIAPPSPGGVAGSIGAGLSTAAHEQEEQEYRCRRKYPRAIPIRWPSPLWRGAGINDPGSTNSTYDMPHQELLIKRGSTFYDRSAPEIGRYLQRIQNPPFNQWVRPYPAGWPVHHKWPLYLGGPGNGEQAEGEYDAEGRIVVPPNLVVMLPGVHSAWHQLLERQPNGPRQGQGPSGTTPDGTAFCVLNMVE